ncbi:UbiA family prenyltransferase [Actinoplanes sp. NBRC 101535]|uniref:UbiA family prenyltransferase n=1 Tax=Actinoplanes sp. NBRC 101535 TaxID=3032196 RepID=UPI0024A3B643|nr:UbiA family prenyltransferase [Actinoplanes sp. NBRC 101535]GLY05397.1 hypothetical protein Acsp01_57760 [Actinoplanes sp. NBRC 101535]
MTVFPGVRPTVGAYARLAKLDVFDYYLAVPLAWTLLPGPAATDPRILVTLLLCLAGTVALLGAGVALDDITGYADGSDAANYRSDAANRRLARKPLLTGELTVDQARAFAIRSAAAGLLCWPAAWALSPGRPAGPLVLMAVCAALALGYSAGPKFSYRGGQELTLVGFGAGVLVIAYGLVTGQITAGLVVLGVLFGIGPLIFGLYANAGDAAGDAAAGRRTLATMVPPRAYRLVILLVVLLETGVLAGAVLTGISPPLLAVVYAPVLALRGAQTGIGLVLGDGLAARRLGIRTHRLGVFLIGLSALLGEVLP